MTFDDAKRKAIDFVDMPQLEVCQAMQTENEYIFFFDVHDAEIPTPDAPIVTVRKDNGEAKDLILPSKEGFELLDSAVEI